MSLEARLEAKKLAEQAFSIARDRILEKYGDPGSFAHEKTGQSKNRGTYAPALIEWAAARVREQILAFADTHAQAFTAYDIPSDPDVEAELKAVAQQITAGTISAVRGQEQLKSMRTRATTAPVLTREIEQAQRVAVREGALTLRKQRTKHLKDKTLEVLGEEGLITGTETLEQWRGAFLEYRNRFPELGRFGLVAERLFRLMEARCAKLEKQNAEGRAAIQTQRELVVRAWHRAKTTAMKPEVWEGYRSEFEKLRLQQQQLPTTTNRPNRLETIGDFASGFKIEGGDSRISAYFSQISVRAGRELGPPDGFDPAIFWHTCVFLYLLEGERTTIFTSGANGDDGGTVRYPLEASEEVCSWLAEEALRIATSQVANAFGLMNQTANAVGVETEKASGAAETSSQTKSGRDANRLKAARYGFLRNHCKKVGLSNLDALARRLGVSITALRGMASGDTKRYGAEKLGKVLETLEKTTAQWDDPDALKSL